MKPPTEIVIRMCPVCGNIEGAERPSRKDCLLGTCSHCTPPARGRTPVTMLLRYTLKGHA